MDMKGTVLAVCTAPAKGVQKHDQKEGRLVPGKGIDGDGHFGFAHRQVSLLDSAEIEKMKKAVPDLFHGAFAENLVTEGIDLKRLVLGDLLRAGGALLRVTQIGKECHSRCAIYEAAGDCIMPRLGIFCEVLSEGTVATGDTIEYVPEEGAELLAFLKITRIDGEKRTAETDRMLKEGRVTLVVDDEEQVTVVCTPGEERYWAIGHLKCRRLLKSRDDIASLEIAPGRVSVNRKRMIEGIPLLQRILSSSSSAMVADGAEQHLADELPSDWSIPPSFLREGAEWLAEAPVFRATGGTHVAALLGKNGEKLFRTEDIGRHNAVDKAVGWALLHAIPPGETALVVSGRLPVDMVMKALGAGIPVLGSVSAATADGVEAAEKGGLTLAGFIRGERMNVYTHPERIAENRG
jgi:FdhD protein